MEADLEKLSLKQISFDFKQYTIKSNITDDFQISLPLPSDLQALIARNNQNDQIILDEKKLSSFFKSDDTLDLREINTIHNIPILYAVCGFLGCFNVDTELYSLKNFPQPDVLDEKWIENQPNYFSYIKKNETLLFNDLLKLQDFKPFLESLSSLGLSIPQTNQNTLYLIIREQLMSNNKILLIVSPGNNFWIKSKEAYLGKTVYSKELNNYTYIYYNEPFIIKFFAKFLKHPRVFLALVSSMKYSNFKSTYDAMKRHGDIPRQDVIPADYDLPLLDQECHENKNPNSKSKPIFVRDINKIYGRLKKSKEYGEIAKTFETKNTLILESEIGGEDDKTEYTRATSLRMNLFSEQYLLYDNEKQKKFEEYQDKLIAYVEKLLEECTDDVRDYLNKHKLEY